MSHQRHWLVERPDPPTPDLWRKHYQAAEVEVRYDGGTRCETCGCPKAYAVTTVIGRGPGGLEVFRIVSEPGEELRVSEEPYGVINEKEAAQYLLTVDPGETADEPMDPAARLSVLTDQIHGLLAEAAELQAQLPETTDD